MDTYMPMLINCIIGVLIYETLKHALTKKYKIDRDKYFVKKEFRFFYKELSQDDFIKEFNK